MAARNNPFQTLVDQIPAPLRNRYFLALALFFAWMIFFDKHDLITQWNLQQSVNKLEQDREYYTREIEKAQQNRKELQVNREKFAREEYFLKKSDEDVFIIIEEENDQSITNR